jgi:hypothetical protein
MYLSLCKVNTVSEVGRQTLQGANPQILELIPLSQNLRCASLEMANPQICMIYPQIANPQILTKYSTTLSQNSRLFPISLCYTLK